MLLVLSVPDHRLALSGLRLARVGIGAREILPLSIETCQVVRLTNGKIIRLTNKHEKPLYGIVFALRALRYSKRHAMSEKVKKQGCYGMDGDRSGSVRRSCALVFGHQAPQMIKLNKIKTQMIKSPRLKN